jgi:type II secretory pathway pseudopilin PulG
LARCPGAFSFTDFLVVLAVLSILAAVAVPILVKTRSSAHLAQCLANLNQINHAVQMYADEHQHRLPQMTNCPAPGAWWFYKEQVKGYLGLTGVSSRDDKVFACPDDRGYGDAAEPTQPFHLSKKHDYTSYVFNSVDLPGLPNVAGRELSSLRDPARTLLVMEWTAHAPLSWHRSRTGRANTPFYNDAENVVGFADGHVALIPIYFDGCNPAYTRDPIPGYAYKYSGD